MLVSLALSARGQPARSPSCSRTPSAELGKAIIQTLTDHPKNRRLLLLLDNCEHLLDASAQLADTLVRHCAGVETLTTTREALGTSGEQAYRVPSLSLPDRKEAPTPQSLWT